jgi:TRAP-type mannitol/chloroaromatic compound transport system substrate-binding protein/predicted secreted protein
MKSKCVLAGIALLLVVSALVLSACSGSTTAQSQPIKWKMATSWSADIYLYTEGAQAICQRVNQLSGGRLVIEASPADAQIGAFDVFDAVSTGKVECGHGWPGYWTKNEPSFELFSSIPDMMTQQEWMIWLYGPSRGIDLWSELYGKYNVIPFPGALNGPEFGFFTNKPVLTLDDFKGLKLRAVGMAADVLKELGATTVSLPVAEIVPAMKNGTIDGCEFNTPTIDWQLGFQNAAKFAALPSWHQPSCMYDAMVNKDAWNKLPDDLKAIFEAACKEVSTIDYMATVEGQNADVFRKFEQAGLQVTTLDTLALSRISEIAVRLADEKASSDQFFAKVLKSQRDFTADYRTWEQWGDYTLYSSSQSSSASPSQMAVDASYNGKEVRIPLGTLLQVALDSNRTTGFGWELTGIGDSSVLSKLSNTYETPQVKLKEGAAPLVGVGGMEFWKFQTLKKGRSTLSMQYSQSWSGGTKGAKIFDLTVIVE